MFVVGKSLSEHVSDHVLSGAVVQLNGSVADKLTDVVVMDVNVFGVVKMHWVLSRFDG